MSVTFTSEGVTRTGPPIDDDTMVGLSEDDIYSAPFPHCDANVLHHPFDNCVHCNHYPALQLARFDNKIAFTGRWREGLELCPAEQARPLEMTNRWGGNVAMTPERKAEEEAYWENLRGTLGS